MCQEKRVGVQTSDRGNSDTPKSELQQLFRRQRFALQQIGDALLEPLQIQRLGEEIIGLHRRGAPGHIARQRAHEDDWDFFGGRLEAQNFTNGQAIEVGQQNIKQD